MGCKRGVGCDNIEEAKGGGLLSQGGRGPLKVSRQQQVKWGGWRFVACGKLGVVGWGWGRVVGREDAGGGRPSLKTLHR